MQAEDRAELAQAMLRRSRLYAKGVQAEDRAELAQAMLRRSRLYAMARRAEGGGSVRLPDVLLLANKNIKCIQEVSVGGRPLPPPPLRDSSSGQEESFYAIAL